MQMIVLVQINVTLDAKNGFASQEWERCVFFCTVLAHVTLNKKVLSLTNHRQQHFKIIEKNPPNFFQTAQHQNQHTFGKYAIIAVSRDTLKKLKDQRRR